jgi:predicted DsbA family dithiol-disulfide isomerase
VLHIGLYTEITCPWCIIGQYRLNKVLAERFPDLVADIRHHPVLLLPDAPAGGLYIPDLLRSRYSASDPKAVFSTKADSVEARSASARRRLSRTAIPTCFSSKKLVVPR